MRIWRTVFNRAVFTVKASTERDAKRTIKRTYGFNAEYVEEVAQKTSVFHSRLHKRCAMSNELSLSYKDN